MHLHIERVSSVSTALLSCPGIFTEEAASIRHVTPRPPMTRRQWDFWDKGIAVKSERVEGVSLRHPLNGHHRQRPCCLWNQHRYKQRPPGFLLVFFLFCFPRQSVQGCSNTCIQVRIIRQASPTGRCVLFKCWERRLTVSLSTTAWALQSHIACMTMINVTFFRSKNLRGNVGVI